MYVIFGYLFGSVKAIGLFLLLSLALAAYNFLCLFE
jgi:hypothetical protein